MIETRARLLIVALLGLAVVGCSAPGGGGPEGSVTPIPAGSDASMASPSADPAPSVGGSPDAPASDPIDAAATDGVSLTQAWATASLTDVATGEAFRIADLAGSVVIVETMAIWCSSCRAQQEDVQVALERLPSERVVYVVLDVDPNEDAASLAEYQQAQGFRGRYAIAGRDVARALAADFGDQFLNPPSTPMLFIGTDGTVTRTDFGHKSVDVIVDLAEAHGA